MVLLPAQTLAQRQAGGDWVRAVNDYTIGDSTVRIRATAKSWKDIRPWVRIFLDEPGTTIQYSIGEQTGQPALLGRALVRVADQQLGAVLGADPELLGVLLVLPLAPLFERGGD